MSEGLLLAAVLCLAYLAAVWAAHEIESRGSFDSGPAGAAPIVGGLLGLAVVVAAGISCAPLT
ncbi:hypothetical protein ACFWTE_28350 [Nocardiopsis sp. NPDC058631]|uniref:hypothetical protein n=1 Tax=Nocardiopsis sp. NPDC058631 TaxID=3346566 RepID=UPI003665ACDB